MHIDWMTLCTHAEPHDGNSSATLVRAGIDTFWIPAMPATISFMVAVRATALAEEYDGGEIAHPCRIVVSDPGGEVLVDTPTAPIRLVAPHDPERRDWLKGMMTAVRLDLELADYGTYTVDFCVDESSQSLPLHVVAVEPG